MVGRGKKSQFWKGIGEQTSGPTHLTYTNVLLNCSSAVSVVLSQKRSSSSFNCGSEEKGDGNCEMQSFVKEC